KLNAPVQQADGTFLGGNLFASTDGSAKITAANITLSSGWLNGTVHLLSSRTPDAPSGENSNIGNMISAMDKKQEFKTPAGTISFNGTFQECFTNMVNVEAIDQKSATTSLKNYLTVTTQLANSKDSVSGVNQDEEVMNMMQFNTSLNAASRLMTALDETLSTIISSMGLVGR
ncbi:MAG: flagellar basal body rod C-terminal domain-containing protein, partial [Hungatella sp.]